MLKFLSVTIFFILLASCSSHYKSVTQVNEKAFLQIEGNYWGTQLIIDNQKPINISKNNIKSFNLDGRDVVLFPISTGKHSLKIIREEQVIVNKAFYVSNGNTFEVLVK